MCNTLTDYNDRNNISLSNANIREEIRKFAEEESITNAKNVTADTFSHASNARRENENAIFTSEKLDKSDDLTDAVNNLTVNNAKYHESNTVITNDVQGDLKRDLETITCTRTSNFGEKLWSNWNIPVLTPPTNHGADQGI